MRLFGRRNETRTVETLSREEVFEVLEKRSQELLGVSGDVAIKMAEAGELPDDIPGGIVSSWVVMTKGVQLSE